MLRNTYVVPGWMIFTIIICFVIVLIFAIWISSIIANRRGYNKGVLVTRMEKRRKIREENLRKYSEFYDINNDIYDIANKTIRLTKRNH